MLVSVFLLANSCASVPLTGRKQMNLLPNSTMTQMGLTSYADFLKENPLSRNRAAEQEVKRAGARISGAVEDFFRKNGLEDQLADFQWEFNLVADESPNAWCMPGGKVVFYEGILPLTKNEAGIAVVMGHEIAHAVARHGNERMSQGLLTQVGVMALSKALEKKPAETQQLFMAVYGLGSQIGVLLPYSRLHEREADRMGLIFMAMAGYDPGTAVEFWERMSQHNKQQVPEWLSTHPLDEKRIQEMKANLPEALKYYTLTSQQ